MDIGALWHGHHLRLSSHLLAAIRAPVEIAPTDMAGRFADPGVLVQAQGRALGREVEEAFGGK